MNFGWSSLLAIAITVSSLLAALPDGQMHGAARAAGVTAEALDVAGSVGSPRQFTEAGLDALPQWTMQVTYGAGTSLQTSLFSGPSLLNVIEAAGGLQTDPKAHNDRLRKYIVATGTDGYQVVIAWGETDADFGAAPIFVATERDDQPLDESEGMARIVVPGDKRGGRHVAQLIRLDLRG